VTQLGIEETRGRNAKLRNAKNVLWGLDQLTPSQMQKLNCKLDEYQDKPRNMSEPKLKYIPTPDLRPEIFANLNPQVQFYIKNQIKEGTYEDKDSF
jgi:hypothetical protein